MAFALLHWPLPALKPHVIPQAPFLWHSLDIQLWQVLIGEIEKLGPLSSVASLLSVYLTHSRCPLLDISPIFIWEPKDLRFREDDHEAGKDLRIPGVGAEHRDLTTDWGI